MKSLIESSKLALEFNKVVKSTIQDKALHNSYIPLKEASIEKLIESVEWYKTELSKSYISAENRNEYSMKLSSVTEELKFREATRFRK